MLHALPGLIPRDPELREPGTGRVLILQARERADRRVKVGLRPLQRHLRVVDVPFGARPALHVCEPAADRGDDDALNDGCADRDPAGAARGATVDAAFVIPAAPTDKMPAARAARCEL